MGDLRRARTSAVYLPNNESAECLHASGDGYPVFTQNSIKEARTKEKDEKESAEALKYQRQAQFYLDFVEAENSAGFHAPQEAARILAESINFSRLGQSSLHNRK